MNEESQFLHRAGQPGGIGYYSHDSGIGENTGAFAGTDVGRAISKMYEATDQL